MASQQGLGRIRQARNEKGWTVEDDRWLREASKIVDPHTNWEAESYAAGRIFAAGVSLATWKRFLYGQDPIDTNVFRAFCQVLELNWEEVVDRSPSPKPQIRWELVWSATIDDARKERVEAILAHLRELAIDDALTLVKIEKGSVILVLQGSPEGFERIQALFREGRLAELLGIPVEDVRRAAVKLSQWLQKNLDEALQAGWQTIEDIFGAQIANQAFRSTAARGANATALTLQLAEHPVALIVAVMPESQQTIPIILQVRPTGSQTYLPQNLKLTVLDETGNSWQIPASENDSLIQFKLTGHPGERFTVKIAVGDAEIVRRYFVI